MTKGIPPRKSIPLSFIEVYWDVTIAPIGLLVLGELRTVFTLKLPHTVCIGLALKNHVFIRNLCREYEQETKLTHPNILPSLQLSDY
ncbi:hypothetical protein FQR65_LT17952 [Abscondita terminalis]|nr:hypothetical protein FQR65_LT17952 [Abscondita terminalis]